MPAATNKATVRAMLEDICTARDLAAVDRAFAPDAASSGGPRGAGAGPGGYWRYVRWLLGVVPDLQLTVEDQLAEGDQVARPARGCAAPRRDRCSTSRPPTGRSA